MKKNELIKKVANETSYTQEVVEEIIDAMQPIIVAACLDDDEEVNLPELGKFKRKVFTARKGRNPFTGEALDIPESHTIAFKPNSKLKRTIQPKPAKGKKK